MAKTVVRNFFKYVFVLLTLIVVLFFLLGCLTFWLNPLQYWFIGFAGLFFPYTSLLLLMLCLFWFIAKPKYAFICLLILGLGYKHYQHIFNVKKTKEFSVTKADSSIRIITWNIQSFNGLSSNKEAKKFIKTDIENCINRYNADVVCLQEFNTTTIDKDAANNIQLFQKNYPYYFFSKDYEKKSKNYQSGCVIFSKLPIVGTGKIKYPANESLIFADVVKNNDTCRIYTTHLQSFKFKKEDYDEMDNISNNEANSIASMNIAKKMKLAFERRGKQTEIVTKELQNCLLPYIIAGDFNDVPTSYTYNAIAKNMQDAFLQKQFGFGRTFISLSPTLRIDYILAHKNFMVQQFDMVDENLSDHIMLLSDVQLK